MPLDEDHLSPAALERAHRLARKAVQLDPNLPIAHAHLGHVLTFQGQHEQSVAEFEKAIALNPNFTDWRFGTTLSRAGEPARAIQVIETHMRYDPFYVAGGARRVGARPLYAETVFASAAAVARMYIPGPELELRPRLAGCHSRATGQAR